ncbi:MAG TPA: M28 family peptidase [Spirochaetota bacterium]|nr:M28 family peptidase [Spirochaetota bacterium]HPC43475.1 M28 family peptidase [Spirochaetota bacterium]HPL17912.1 M28 family peptidase [Spirochaetota bacterium]HQJ73201.1 M28 family peptidase [Spirochaetota bacterium]HRS79321.1 M28 family peptidase [Spirochaetota bacterium]
MFSRSMIINYAICFLILILPAQLFLSCGAEVPAGPSELDKHRQFVPDNREMLGYIKDLTSFGYRRTGTPAGERAVEYIRDRFAAFGLKNVEIERFNSYRWQSLQCELTVAGEKIDVFPIADSMRAGEFGEFSTGGQDRTANIVYVGKGSEEDYRRINVKNKIVVSDILFYDVEWRDFKGMSYFTHDPAGTLDGGMKHENPYISRNFPSNYYRAQENGAAGFVGVLVDYFDRNTYYNEDLSLSSEFRDRGYMKIPGLYVSRSVGQNLKRMVREKPGAVTAMMKFAARVEPASALNVIGYLPGKSRDIILVHSHHDSVFTGAVQDASGVAVVMAMAKYFSSAPSALRDKTLLFAAFDSHFSGYVANKGFIKRHREKGERIVLDVCVEHVGMQAKNDNGRLVMTGDVEPRGIFVSENSRLISIAKQAALKHDYGRFALLPTFSPLGVCSDAFYLHKSGVPVISLISPPLYIYDKDDTIDKVAVDQLNPTASMLIDVVAGADAMTPDDIERTSFIVSHRVRYYRWLAAKIVEMIME